MIVILISRDALIHARHERSTVRTSICTAMNSGYAFDVRTESATYVLGNLERISVLFDPTLDGKVE